MHNAGHFYRGVFHRLRRLRGQRHRAARRRNAARLHDQSRAAVANCGRELIPRRKADHLRRRVRRHHTARTRRQRHPTKPHPLTVTMASSPLPLVLAPGLTDEDRRIGRHRGGSRRRRGEHNPGEQ